MKKMLRFVCISTLCVSMVTPVAAESQSKPLYEYGELSDGSYGYKEDHPVMYYDGSDEPIHIPTQYVQQKEQFKSGWIATIFSLNMPVVEDGQAFKEAYLKRLDDYKDWNMNAMIFQVRPLLDAFYPSKINPASQYLSGQQGVDVDFGFDPLAWMIEETHQAGMEYHAWFNPYRVTNLSLERLTDIGDKTVEDFSVKEHIQLLHERGILADNNFAVLHPETVIRFDGKLILNPGLPEVVDHVNETIKEVIENYDVDAIHFDDYFYPYGNAGGFEQAPDLETFKRYGKDFEQSEKGFEAWRRANTTTLIKTLHDTIGEHNQATGNSVQLGISPFGIWEHYDNDPRGSHTPVSSSATYSKSVFADTYQWVQDEIIDYIAPQIYWNFSTAAAPYGELARWWSSIAEGKNVHVYVGHANYKNLDASSWDKTWLNPEEINNQMHFNQTLDNIHGSSFYSYTHMVKGDVASAKNPAGQQAVNDAIDILKNDSFKVGSLTPAKPWLAQSAVKPVDQATLNGNTLSWHDTQNQHGRFYVIYQGSQDASVDAILANPENIIKRTMVRPEQTDYEIELSQSKGLKTIITVLDKAFVESDPVVASTPVRIEKDDAIAKDFLGDIHIDSSDNAFNEPYHFQIKQATLSESMITQLMDTLKDMLRAQHLEMGRATIIDIDPLSDDETPLSANDEARFTITLPLPQSLEGAQNIKVYHFAEDGTVEAMDTQFKHDTIEFKTNHFSHFALVEILERPEEPVKPEAKPEPKPEDHKPETPTTEKLPATGQSPRTLTTIGLPLAFAGLVLLKRKKD